ncbi:hypothetical protein QM716_16005 [Rhodococcus sp. IEGM 1409]|nr:hypothetical protein [Rhodococcus sp. IEGM 1409]MDI9901363.1 hypothetical protein [Rhodococcus sp. IEGM 1409]
MTLNYEGESSYVPFAEKYKECGAKGIWTSRSASPSELNFVKALDQVGIDPIFFGEATWCGATVSDWNYIHEWDGGGLHAVTDPGKNMPATCGPMTSLKGNTHSPAFPSTAGEFKCDPKYLVATDKSTWGTELGADRVSTKY